MGKKKKSSDMNVFTPRSLQALESWYDRSARELPWRKNPDPYHIWLAEVMSQQTQLAAVLPYFYKFIERYETVRELAKASQQQVDKLWAGLGYYSRARNLLKTAKLLAQSERIPETYDEWIAMPGIGPYSAAAIVSQAFMVPRAVWDGNVLRVMARLTKTADAHEAAFRENCVRMLDEVIKGRNPSKFNQAMMELGATVCMKKNPACNKCPVSGVCVAWKSSKGSTELIEQYPQKKKRKDKKKFIVKTCVEYHRTPSGKYYIRLHKREQSDWYASLWDVRSELGGVRTPIRKTRIEPDTKRLGKFSHHITHHDFQVIVHAQQVKDRKSNPESKWIPIDALLENTAPIPVATTAKKSLKIFLKNLNGTK